MALGKNVAIVAVAVIVTAAVGARAARAEEGERGRVLFALCTACHGPDGAGNELFRAPAIAGLPRWYVEAQLQKFRSGVRGTHPDDLQGMRMRPMSLALGSDEDVVAVAAAVADLERTRLAPVVSGGDPARGAQLYASCVACHGVDGRGNRQLNAPPLAGASDWYLIEQLQKFKAGIRGADPKDATGILMRPMALTLPDEQAMKDVIAHVMTLSR
ncbi:MAG: c-type cytochrome [Myxococcota bacterium]